MAHNTKHKLHSLPNPYFIVDEKFLLWVEEFSVEKFSQGNKKYHAKRKFLTRK